MAQYIPLESENKTAIYATHKMFRWNNAANNDFAIDVIGDERNIF